MKSRIVSISSWLFISVLSACGNDSSPARKTDATTDAGESDQGNGRRGGDGDGGSRSDEDKHDIGGEVSGLIGSGLVLKLNEDDNLDVGESGPFTFKNKLAKDANYRVSVGTQPSDPVQACEVTQGSGKVEEADIDSVRVACSDVKRTIAGSVTGLGGGEIKLKYNGGSTLTVKADGNFLINTTFDPSHDKRSLVPWCAPPPSPACIAPSAIPARQK